MTQSVGIHFGNDTTYTMITEIYHALTVKLLNRRILSGNSPFMSKSRLLHLIIVIISSP